MFILGIHAGHDSSAAVLHNGEIVADAAEERFVRIKHYCGLPHRALSFCLESAGIQMEDVDVIAISSCLQRPYLNHLFKFPSGREQKESLQRKALHSLKRFRGYAVEKLPLYIRPFPVSRRTEIVNIEHHLAHASSAYYTSGCQGKQLVVTMDGTGDNVSTAVWRGEHGRLTPLQKWGFEGSLGVFYSNVTEALGWWHGDGEGKTMGLAPYGNPGAAAGALKTFHPGFARGELIRPKDFGLPHTWPEAGALHHHFDEAENIVPLLERHGRENIAAEAQRILEEEAGNIIFSWLEREGTKDLSCAGGVFLNVKLNQRIWESGKVANQWIYPNPGDSGLAVGAALQAWHNQSGALPGTLDHLYHGPQFGDEEIARLLELRKIPFIRVDDPARFAADRLAKNEIVAWFQGRMESGPRALGHRSILMSAARKENKDEINAKVKFREAFRPFCPSLCDEERDNYLINARSEPFMITSFTCPEAKRSAVPAVVHEDGTLRPQTVKKEIEPTYHRLLSEFGKLTGDPVVLNTSMNLMGEPISCSPRDAIRCFFDNGINALIMGDVVIEKSAYNELP